MQVMKDLDLTFGTWLKYFKMRPNGGILETQLWTFSLRETMKSVFLCAQL